MAEKARNKQAIFDFIFDMAFRDATMRTAFPKKDKNVDDEKFKELKSNIKNAIKPEINNYLNELLDNKTCITDKLICDHINKVIEDIEKSVKQNEVQQYAAHPFSFGNAQKVVNMAAKYLYIACYADPNLKKKFERCHCPMDRIMIKGIINEAKNRRDIDIDNNKLSLSTSWSKIGIEVNQDKEAYCEFQRIIKKLCEEGESSLDYDYNHWASFAEDI